MGDPRADRRGGARHQARFERRRERHHRGPLRPPHLHVPRVAARRPRHGRRRSQAQPDRHRDRARRRSSARNGAHPRPAAVPAGGRCAVGVLPAGPDGRRRLGHRRRRAYRPGRPRRGHLHRDRGPARRAVRPGAARCVVEAARRRDGRRHRCPRDEREQHRRAERPGRLRGRLHQGLAGQEPAAPDRRRRPSRSQRARADRPHREQPAPSEDHREPRPGRSGQWGQRDPHAAGLRRGGVRGRRRQPRHQASRRSLGPEPGVERARAVPHRPARRPRPRGRIGAVRDRDRPAGVVHAAGAAQRAAVPTVHRLHRLGVREGDGGPGTDAAGKHHGAAGQQGRDGRGCGPGARPPELPGHRRPGQEDRVRSPRRRVDRHVEGHRLRPAQPLPSRLPVDARRGEERGPADAGAARRGQPGHGRVDRVRLRLRQRRDQQPVVEGRHRPRPRVPRPGPGRLEGPHQPGAPSGAPERQGAAGGDAHVPPRYQRRGRSRRRDRRGRASALEPEAHRARDRRGPRGSLDPVRAARHLSVAPSGARRWPARSPRPGEGQHRQGPGHRRRRRAPGARVVPGADPRSVAAVRQRRSAAARRGRDLRRRAGRGVRRSVPGLPPGASVRERAGAGRRRRAEFADPGLRAQHRLQGSRHQGAGVRPGDQHRGQRRRPRHHDLRAWVGDRRLAGAGGLQHRADRRRHLHAVGRGHADLHRPRARRREHRPRSAAVPRPCPGPGG